MTLGERWDRRIPPWLEAVIIGITSRLFAAAVLVSATMFRLPVPTGRIWQNPFLVWDAEWYLWVARFGYHANAVSKTPFGSGYHDFAFFPLWPGVIVAVTLGGRLALDVMAPLAANLLFVLATVPIQRVLERVGGRSYARFGLLLFAFSPAAYVYSQAYSEPLFLLLAGLSLATSGYARPAMFAGLAMLSRLGGAALAVAALPDLLRPETRRRGFAVIVWVGGAFALWWLYIATLTHDWFGYMLGSPAWYAADTPTGSLTGIASILNAPLGIVWITIALLTALLVGTIALFRRGEYRLAMFSLAAIGSAWLVTYNTMPRIVAVAFPAFAAFAGLLPNNKVRWLVIGVSAASEAILGALAIGRVVIP